MALFSEFGINRLSIGIQSFNQDERDFLGRQHNNKDLQECRENLCNSPIKNINIDLIYGLSISTLNHLKHTFQTLKEYPVTHISSYALSIENGTPFEKQNVKPLDDEKEAEHYQYIINELTKNHYHHYEVAAFAKKGFECLHNLSYWNFEDYIGLGPSAHSFVFPYRFKNPNNLEKYLKNPSPEWQTNKLIPNTKKTLSLEFFCSTLRLKKGFKIECYENRFLTKIPKKTKQKFCELESKKLIQQDKERIYCTKKGRQLLNEVLIHLTED